MSSTSRPTAGRRAIVGAIALTATTFAAAAFAADATSGRSTSVLTYRGDAARTGVMPGPAPGGTPSIVWRFEAAQRLASSPTLEEGIVHVVSADGLVHGLSLDDGDERWTVDLGVQADATPLIADGVLVVGDETGGLHGLGPADGTIRWTLGLDGAMTGAPAYDADRGLLVAATHEGTAYGIDPATGREGWSTDLAGRVIRSVAIADGTAFMGVSPGAIVALDTADGSVRWRRRLAESGDVMSPSVADGRLYLALGGAARGRLWALDATTGDAIWELGMPPSVSVYPPAIADGRAYVVRTDGVVQALDAATGALAWSVGGRNPLEALPALVDDVLLVAGNGGPLEALDVATGRTLWTVPVAGTPWAPIAADGVVLVPTDRGILYAIGSEDRP